MAIKIFSKRLGINFVHLIKADGCIMIDVGPSFAFSGIKTWFNSIPINPTDVSLIVITHAHFDHAGAVAEAKELTKAQVAVHRSEQDMLRTGITPLPTPAAAWGKVGYALMKPLKKVLPYPGLEADLVIADEGLPLNEFGIPGRIIHTPGHTKGSMSVLLDNGDAFVGCMTHNGPPFRLSPNHPIFANDLDRLWNSWKLLLDQGAKTIYPGHGKPFSIDEIQRKFPKEMI